MSASPANSSWERAFSSRSLRISWPSKTSLGFFTGPAAYRHTGFCSTAYGEHFLSSDFRRGSTLILIKFDAHLWTQSNLGLASVHLTWQGNGLRGCRFNVGPKRVDLSVPICVHSWLPYDTAYELERSRIFRFYLRQCSFPEDSP